MSDSSLIQNHYIYLLQEREFIKSNEPIYKIGKTTKTGLTRFSNYPNGSDLLFHIKCNDCHTYEKLLIDLFKNNYILRKDIGNEYFEGDYKHMIRDIYDKISFCDNTSPIPSTIPAIIPSPIPAIIDNYEPILYKFIKTRICYNTDSNLTLSQVHYDFRLWFYEYYSIFQIKLPSAKLVKHYFELKFGLYLRPLGWKGISLSNTSI
jgi:hypothetical protein